MYRPRCISVPDMCLEYPSNIQGNIAVASELLRQMQQPTGSRSCIYMNQHICALKFRVGFPFPIPIIRVETVVHFVVQEQVVGDQQEEQQ